MPGEAWLSDAQKACQSREAFEQNYHALPGKIRSLLKHMDQRSKSPRNTEKDLEKLSPEEVKALQGMLKYHQSLPLNHNYPKPRHQSKYRGKAKSQNHLISRDDLKKFDKRGS